MLKKGYCQCQIIYVINPDRKDVVFVIVIFILRNYTAHAVPQSLGQNHAARSCGINYDLSWNSIIEATTLGS